MSSFIFSIDILSIWSLLSCLLLAVVSPQQSALRKPRLKISISPELPIDIRYSRSAHFVVRMNHSYYGTLDFYIHKELGGGERAEQVPLFWNDLANNFNFESAQKLDDNWDWYKQTDHWGYKVYVFVLTQLSIHYSGNYSFSLIQNLSFYHDNQIYQPNPPILLTREKSINIQIRSYTVNSFHCFFLRHAA